MIKKKRSEIIFPFYPSLLEKKPGGDKKYKKLQQGKSRGYDYYLISIKINGYFYNN